MNPSINNSEKILGAPHRFSRKVVTIAPLEGSNAGRVIDALEIAFENCGKPKPLISDQGSVFTSAAFREFIDLYDVKIRYGAVGQHGSIAVTERVIETLKYEWLKKVAIIRGFRHLTQLCTSFTECYNNWRLHEFLGSATPGSVYLKKAVPLVRKNSKSIPANLVIKRFRETKVIGYRIKKAA